MATKKSTPDLTITAPADQSANLSEATDHDAPLGASPEEIATAREFGTLAALSTLGTEGDSTANGGDEKKNEVARKARRKFYELPADQRKKIVDRRRVAGRSLLSRELAGIVSVPYCLKINNKVLVPIIEEFFAPMDRVASTFDFSAKRIFKDKAQLVKTSLYTLLEKAEGTITTSLRDANLAWDIEFKNAKEKGADAAITIPRIAIPMLEQDISIYSPLALRVAKAVVQADELLFVHSKLAWNGFRSAAEIRGVERRVMADLRSFLIRAYQINMSFLTGRPMQVEAMLEEAPLSVDADPLESPSQAMAAIS